MPDKKIIKVIIIGGSGYAGFEAIRYILAHDNAKLVGIFGPEGELGPMDEFYPVLSGQLDMKQELFEQEKVASLGADLALLCVPHQVAMSYVPALRDAGIRIIDFSADYRIADVSVYEKWYCKHTDPGALADAAYGLCEYFADSIATAQLVANPGCYPTCTTLALAPILQAGLIESSGIVVNAISGVSGAGRKPNLKCHYPERNENFEPYGVGTHRHMPEMEQTLSNITGREVSLLFQPHLCPMDRGMLCSIYADPIGDVTQEQLNQVLADAYHDKPFVRVRPTLLPATKYTTGTNFCDIHAAVAKGKVILFSSIDNVAKGAAGQAIQNMNIMFGFDETEGLL